MIDAVMICTTYISTTMHDTGKRILKDLIGEGNSRPILFLNGFKELIFYLVYLLFIICLLFICCVWRILVLFCLQKASWGSFKFDRHKLSFALFLIKLEVTSNSKFSFFALPFFEFFLYCILCCIFRLQRRCVEECPLRGLDMRGKIKSCPVPKY